MRFLRILTIGLFVLAPLRVAADPAHVALSFADDFTIPRFQAVAAAAHAQEGAWSKFCTDRTHGDPDTLKKAFNDLADAWANIEFVRIGPAAVALRVERFNWWLDRTNATGKALSAMLATTDPQNLTPDKLAAGSVAGQGLPILERLLYAPGATAQLQSEPQRCVVGTAVARGQSVIADAIVTDWTAPDGARAALAANTRWNVAFADAKEAASVMLTDLATGLEGLKDFKVAMLFHDTTNANAPKLAEATFSGRTVHDIRLNLAAIHQALGIFLVNASPAAKYRLDAAFDDALNALNATERPKMSAQERLAAIQLTLASFGALSQTGIAVLPEATGLTLGFNNLDGD